MKWFTDFFKSDPIPEIQLEIPADRPCDNCGRFTMLRGRGIFDTMVACKGCGTVYAASDNITNPICKL